MRVPTRAVAVMSGKRRQAEGLTDEEAWAVIDDVAAHPDRERGAAGYKPVSVISEALMYLKQKGAL